MSQKMPENVIEYFFNNYVLTEEPVNSEQSGELLGNRAWHVSFIREEKGEVSCLMARLLESKQ